MSFFYSRDFRPDYIIIILYPRDEDRDTSRVHCVRGRVTLNASRTNDIVLTRRKNYGRVWVWGEGYPSNAPLSVRRHPASNSSRITARPLRLFSRVWAGYGSSLSIVRRFFFSSLIRLKRVRFFCTIIIIHGNRFFFIIIVVHTYERVLSKYALRNIVRVYYYFFFSQTVSFRRILCILANAYGIYFTTVAHGHRIELRQLYFKNIFYHLLYHSTTSFPVIIVVYKTRNIYMFIVVFRYPIFIFHF